MVQEGWNGDGAPSSSGHRRPSAPPQSEISRSNSLDSLPPYFRLPSPPSRSGSITSSSFHSANTNVRSGAFTPEKFGRLAATFNKKNMKLYLIKGVKVTAGFLISSLVLFGFSELYLYLKGSSGSEMTKEQLMDEVVDKISGFYENLELDRNETSSISEMLDKVATKFAISVFDLQELIFKTRVSEFTNEEGNFEKEKFKDYAYRSIKELVQKIADKGFHYFFSSNNSTATDIETSQFDSLNGTSIFLNNSNESSSIFSNENNNNNNIHISITVGLIVFGILLLIATVINIYLYKVRIQNELVPNLRSSFSSFFTF